MTRPADIWADKVSYRVDCNKVKDNNNYLQVGKHTGIQVPKKVKGLTRDIEG